MTGDTGPGRLPARREWPEWADRAAEAARRVGQRVVAAASSGGPTGEALARLSAEMRAASGRPISDSEIAAMVGQHFATRPVLDSLFPHQAGPADTAGRALEAAADALAAADPEASADIAPLAPLYESAADALADAPDPAERIDILLDLYEAFFKAAMPAEVARLGVAYTPTEIVDFILTQADQAVRRHFGRGIGSPGVHVVDPFTGTGTFLHRLIARPDLVADSDLDRKYAEEMHASEIMLLAHRVAAIKIEGGYRARLAAAGRDPDTAPPFPGARLGDTFSVSSHSPLLGGRPRWETSDPDAIMVIVGNPPWSAGQKSVRDENPNDDHPHIERRIRETYGASHRRITGRGAGKASGNLYIKGFRWASDQVAGRRGVVAFVHPNSLLTGVSLTGARAHMLEEFAAIYAANLRGDALRYAAARVAEGDKLFESSSRSGILVTVAVADPSRGGHAQIRVAEVPEGASRREKLDWLAATAEAGLESDHYRLVPVTPRRDWYNPSDGSFVGMLPICTSPSEPPETTAAATNAAGVLTACDTHVYAFTAADLADRVARLCDAYNAALDLWRSGTSLPDALRSAGGAVKWTENLQATLRRGGRIEYDPARVRLIQYRPFVKMWLYDDDRILTAGHGITRMFPPSAQEAICLAGPSNRSQFAVVATDIPTDMGCTGSNQPSRTVPRRSDDFEAILVKMPANVDVPDAVLAVDTAPDQHALGAGTGGCRATPRHCSR